MESLSLPQNPLTERGVSLTLTILVQKAETEGLRSQTACFRGSPVLYQRSETLFGSAGLTATLAFDQIIGRQMPKRTPLERFQDWVTNAELVSDLGVDIASFSWFRGLFVCTSLCLLAWLLLPPLHPIPAAVPDSVSGEAWEETRTLSIAPLAWGGDTGRHMAASSVVRPLGIVPERPTLDLTATLGQGDGFRRVLERAGVGEGEALRVAAIVARITPLSDIQPGTLMKMTLGRRTDRKNARPLDSLQFRARFDLALSLNRIGDSLVVRRIPIAIDRTPLRIQGQVGDSLYRSARIAGAPAKAAEAYIRAIATKLNFNNDISSDARFDFVIEHSRAETGEVQIGKLLYAGLMRGNRKTQLLQWTINGATEWFEASGVGQKRAGMAQPVAGRLTSGFGMRFHPLLGYTRMHRGVDYGAAYGSPIYAATDGLVSFAGRYSGNGNYVRLTHSATLGTSYSHMSRILVRAGARVAQGQVIGYVGSTGLSTGPHLHFEVFKNGLAVNPLSISFASRSLLSGNELAEFHARLNSYLALPVGGNTALSASHSAATKPVS
jgi:murein DD-endopeptidase MepM/ murein hydrolase activator NlpD